MTQSKPQILDTTAAGIARAAEVLSEGGLLALPTETVYGLAADARNGTAVARIFEAKGRPAFNPLIVHVPSLEAAEALVEVSATARRLAEAFWPGPVTLVLPSRGHLADLVQSGLPTLAVRVPAHPTARAVLEAFGAPVAAPSANLSGQISATEAGHVVAGLGDRIDAVLDAGPCRVGVESTILAPTRDGVRLLREGGITREQVEAVAGPVVADLTPGRVEAPGQMERHYAPRTKLVMGGSARDGEVAIGFGGGACDLSLSPDGDLVEAAMRLFATLHAADQMALARGAETIRVAQVPDVGLGRAINDRLRRAAH